LAAVTVKTGRSVPRDESGLLIRAGEWLLLRTTAFHHWRLNVDEERVHHLIGLKVRVIGKASGNTISVESIVQE